MKGLWLYRLCRQTVEGRRKPDSMLFWSFSPFVIKLHSSKSCQLADVFHWWPGQGGYSVCCIKPHHCERWALQIYCKVVKLEFFFVFFFFLFLYELSQATGSLGRWFIKKVSGSRTCFVFIFFANASSKDVTISSCSSATWHVQLGFLQKQ